MRGGFGAREGEDSVLMRLVFATGNQGKMGEIRQILSGMDAEILSMKEAGLEVEVPETGKTFEENALLKAEGVARAAQGRDVIVLADDSGLEIDCLGGEPGIYSARYLGRDTSYEVKNQNLLERLSGVPKERRTARFVCAVAAVFPDGTSCVVRETMEGYIGWEIKGEHGFGYDPIFCPEGYSCTSAQLEPEAKNRLSHRGKALRAMREKLERGR